MRSHKSTQLSFYQRRKAGAPLDEDHLERLQSLFGDVPLRAWSINNQADVHFLKVPSQALAERCALDIDQNAENHFSGGDVYLKLNHAKLLTYLDGGAPSPTTPTLANILKRGLRAVLGQ